MTKTKQPELILQPKLIDSLTAQGCYCERVSDRFKAGRPDVRVGHTELGQLDFELKYCTLENRKLMSDIDSGMTKLQWLNLRNKNRAAMPAICLIYVQAFDEFVITDVLRPHLQRDVLRVTRQPGDVWISARELFLTTKAYLQGNGHGSTADRIGQF